MRPPRLIETTELPICDIDCSQRLRPVSGKQVDSLMASLKELGLQSEIQVRRIKKSGKLRLMAGGHRVAAYREMGRDTIPAKVWECTDDQAVLFETDDNLAHAELDVLDTAVFLARRKVAYERIYPETKRGSAGGRAKNGVLTDMMSVSTFQGDGRDDQRSGEKQTDTMSFCQSVAEKFRISDRQVRRLVAAGQALGPAELQDLRRAPRKVTLADLQEIAKCDGPVARYDICRALGDGTAKSAKDALAQKSAPKNAAPSPVEEALRRLNDAYIRASKEARRRFVDAHAAELAELLDQRAEPPGDGDVVPFKARDRG